MAPYRGPLGRIVGPDDPRDYRLGDYMAYGEASQKLEGDVGWGGEWLRRLNQKREGACTAFGLANGVNCRPYRKNLTSQDAFDCYHAVTEWDQIPGSWNSRPPQEGAIPRDAAKEAVKREWIESFAFEYDVNAVLAWLLNHGPVALAMDWYTSFDDPGPDNTLDLGGSVRGGHQIAVIRVEVGVGPVDRVRLKNQWNGKWGDNDRAWMPVSLLSHMFENRNTTVTAFVEAG